MLICYCEIIYDIRHFTLLYQKFLRINYFDKKPFKEYMSVSNEKDEQKAYFKYTRSGGFPYVMNLTDDNDLIMNYLDSVYNTVLMKDIISRKQINDVLMLDSVVRFLFDNIGSLVSTKKISDTLISSGRKNSVNTIENYVNALLESYIIYKVNI